MSTTSFEKDKTNANRDGRIENENASLRIEKGGVTDNPRETDCFDSREALPPSYYYELLETNAKKNNGKAISLKRNRPSSLNKL